MIKNTYVIRTVSNISRKHIPDIISISKINKNENKVKDYRMQEEYGEKKFIKP